MSKPRAWTEEEIREKFFKQIKLILSEWRSYPNKTELERINGIIFSIMAMLDGSSIDIPAFKVIPMPHEDDKEYHVKKGENYYPDDVDIAGSLHDEWFRVRDKEQIS
jgi:hypothetical protein